MTQHTALYERLELTPAATSAEISAAFRRLAKTLHPDTAGEQSKEAFAALVEAKDILLDPERRARYDQFGILKGEKTPDEEDDELVHNMLFGMSEAVILNGMDDVEAVDIVKILIVSIQAKLAEMIAARKALEAKSKRAEKARKRLKPKKAGEQSGMVRILGLQIDQIAKKVAQHHQIERCLAKARKVVEGDSYDFTPPPPGQKPYMSTLDDRMWKSIFDRP